MQPWPLPVLVGLRRCQAAARCSHNQAELLARVQLQLPHQQQRHQGVQERLAQQRQSQLRRDWAQVELLEPNRLQEVPVKGLQEELQPVQGSQQVAMGRCQKLPMERLQSRVLQLWVLLSFAGPVHLPTGAISAMELCRPSAYQ